MGAGGGDAPAVQQDDEVGILDRGDPLGDDELGGLGNLLPEGPADEGVGLGVHGGGGVVENEDLGMLEQGPGDAQPLLLGPPERLVPPCSTMVS